MKFQNQPAFCIMESDHPLTPSHVGAFGNEMADLLAKEGSALPSATSNEHFVSEIFSIRRAKVNTIWRVPPGHDWYNGNLLVCLYSPKVQDPHRQHWPDCELAISKA
ncbi:RNase H domain-containing protein [Nephila pilipes]|uniref:RNase H domain-containing protein n=1 Tax=Nephila pilipes TaxID=299642 RepID=A0A8X6UV79_NEPPI|nr:RNase H domain-containing protein [Nephila pilipes]